MTTGKRKVDGLPAGCHLFAQVPLIWLQLDLHKRLLRRKHDWEVCCVLLRHTTRTRDKTNPANGRCRVFNSVIRREVGLRWDTQVDRCIERICKTGLYRRAGFERVYGQPCRVLYACSGPEIWEFARKHSLIPREWVEAQAEIEHKRRLEREAEDAERRGAARVPQVESQQAQGAGSDLDAEVDALLGSWVRPKRWE